MPLTRSQRLRRSSRLGLIAALSGAFLIGQAALGDAYPRPGRTELVSSAPDGTPGDSHGAFSPSLSADGRFVAFQSYSSNLVADDGNNNRDVFVRDRTAGTVERVSVASDGTEGDVDGGSSPAISADGRHVAFTSQATNLVPGDTNRGSDVNGGVDVFVHDRETGRTERVSVASDGTEQSDDGAWFFATAPSISGDGRVVTFWSTATNLVPDDTNGGSDVFVHDRTTGLTERVSVASDGTQGDRGGDISFPNGALSGDGRYVVFHSNSSNLVPNDANGSARDVFLHDRETGQTEVVSVSSGGEQAEDGADTGQITPDGRFVVFRSSGPNLVPADDGGEVYNQPDVFVRDRLRGITDRVSVAGDASEPDGSAESPAISADGRYVSFSSRASNLTGGETTECRQRPPDPFLPCNEVFVHDRATGSTERVSVSTGTEGDDVFGASMNSSDGRYVSFLSLAYPFRGDTFVRDRGPAIGVGGLTVAAPSAGRVSVTGWATFAGVDIAAADDPDNDGADGARAKGAELYGARLVYRPEAEDVLVEWNALDLPSSAGVAGTSEVAYALDVTVNGTAYQVVARPPNTFVLERCDPGCVPVGPLGGGIGTTGDRIRVSLPLAAVGASEGHELTGSRAFAVEGEPGSPLAVLLDEVSLPSAVVPVAQVWLGTAPNGTPEGDVLFTTRAALLNGQFSDDYDVSPLTPGDYRLWGKACLGEVCGTLPSDVIHIGPCCEPQPSPSDQPPAPGPTDEPSPPVPSATPSVSPSSPPEEEAAVERVSGDSRTATAVQVSATAFPEGAETVLLARQDLYPDALAGGPLAFDRSAPLLLTDSARLSPETAEEISRLGAERVILLGGTQAVREEVRAELEDSGMEVERIGGANRFDTAALIADALGPEAPTAFLAEGANADPARGFPDALSAAPYAAFTGRPILLATKDALPAETGQALRRLGTSETIVVGGAAAVSDAVVSQLADAGHGPRRLAGDDRYATSVAVSDEAVSAGMDPSVLWLATGTNWPDALTSGPAVAALGETFLLVDPADLDRSPATAQAIEDRRDLLRLVRLIGGPGAISPDVQAQVEELLAQE